MFHYWLSLTYVMRMEDAVGKYQSSGKGLLCLHVFSIEPSTPHEGNHQQACTGLPGKVSGDDARDLC